MNETVENKKPLWMSKALWTSLLMSIAAFFPPVQQWISENPGTFSWAISGLFFVIRLVTKDAVSVK